MIRALVLLLALLAAVPARAAACQVTDGDSLVCDGQRIRLVGLDAPELRGRCAEERALARQARDRLRRLEQRPFGWNRFAVPPTGHKLL